MFYDWIFDCWINGIGVIWDYMMVELKKFDIGYGYMVDGGKMYFFCGKGVNFMFFLDEVMKYFLY